MADSTYRVGIEGDATKLKQAGEEGKKALKGIDTEAQKARLSIKGGFDEGGESARMLGGEIAGLAAKFGVFGAGSAAVAAFVTNMEAARDALRDAAKDSTALEASLRELAAMKGKLGGTGAEALQNLKTRVQTLQSSEEVKQFQETFVGSGASSIGNLITQSDFDKLGIMAGKFQAAEGGSAATHGQLAGMMPAILGRKTTDQEAFAKVQQLYNILQPGGSSFSSGVNQFLKNAPLVTTGVYKDAADLMAVQSAFSLSNREGAGENAMQFTRATIGGLGRMKGVPMEGDTQKIGEYLKAIGATNQMDPIQIGKLISNDLLAQEGQEKAAGRNLNIMDYLRHRGYGNQEDMMALMAFHGLQKSGQYKTFEDLASPANAMGGGAAQAAIDEFQATNAVAQARKADVAESLKTFNLGTGPMQYFQSLQKATFSKASVEDPSKFYGKLEDWTNSSWYSDMFQGGRNELTKRMRDELLSEAQRVGINVTDQGKAALGLGPLGMRSEQELAGSYYSLATEIQARGGNVMPGMDQLLKNADAQLKVQEQMRDAFREAQVKGNIAPPINPPLNGPPNAWNGRS